MVQHPFLTLSIVAALLFDFGNGCHDSANAIATLVATKVLTPLQAVAMAGFLNFLGPFILSLAVAATIGKGIIETTPTPIIISSAAAMDIDTLSGGWRNVQTIASRITHLTPTQGFAAETGGGLVLVAMAQAGIPVSTTHAISSSMGLGATTRASAVRWGIGRRIVGA